MESKKQNYLIVCLSALIMIFAIYIGTTLGKRAKLDVTDEGLYSLSDGSKNILKKVTSPLRLKLYYSKTAANKGTEGIRAFNTYFYYVQDLLEEYVANSRNKLSLQVIDPRPDTKEEEDAIRYGLKKFHLTETERYFFGLVVVNEAGTEKIIEFFDPNKQENIEYEITKLIYAAMSPAKKKVGVLSSLPVLTEELSPYIRQLMQMQGKNPESSWTSMLMLKEFYDVVKIEPEQAEINNIDVLVVIHPKGFSDTTLFGIDQYVMKGGKLLVLLDGMPIADQQNAQFGGPPAASEMAKLLDNWGVNLEAGLLAGDKYLAGVGRYSPMAPPGRILGMMNCDERCTSPYKDSITGALNNLTLIYPGVLRIAPAEGVQATTILSTTEKGNSFKMEGPAMNNPELLWESFQEGVNPVPLAAKLVGKFKSAFPKGITVEKAVKGKNDKKQQVKMTALSESKKDTAIVVMADVDFLSDQFAFRRSLFGTAMANDNATFFLNAVEALSGSTDLLAVRSKGRFNRSFDVIEKIEFEAEKNTAKKVQQINASIARFQQELNELGRSANASNLALIQNEGIRKKKQLAQKIAELKGELREVKRVGREKVEFIGKVLQYINTLVMPLMLTIVGLLFYRSRRFKTVGLA